MVDVALFDLDGVVRRFRGSWPDVWSVAFDPGLLELAVTGKISDEEWRAEVLRRLGPGSANEVAAWSASCGEVNEAVLALVRQVRRRAPVGLLTNGTSRLGQDLVTLGIVEEFDVIFNSADLGVAKPDAKVFELVTSRLGVVPSSVFFADDSPAHVDGARRVGFRSSLFVDADLLADVLRLEGLLDEPL
jgi:putative hydrolase of the HAD superfamily